MPAAIACAGNDAEASEAFAALLRGHHFRAYTSDDIVGVELGGALKNVLAIAVGASDGLGFGANTRAALITRGLAEIMQLATRMGAQRETLMGLAGLGDIILTCTDDQSRNRRFGLAIGQGKSVAEAEIVVGQRSPRACAVYAPRARFITRPANSGSNYRFSSEVLPGALRGQDIRRPTCAQPRKTSQGHENL